MNKNFMIGFLYQGHFYCANVHKSRSPHTEYHVSILTGKYTQDMPSPVILKEESGQLRLSPAGSLPQGLLDTIISELQRHENA